ncbi:type II secretion system secretin GspD [Thermodesulfatator atlanticus]|uniref:type II secretion system secretin GspD n=1 Tax=Thermodesulfatator atlanticus TaxID=501497 RepID=UPI0004061BF9|nr:type II secretion system secretin GspD [Thermodesulfatator atlanticus]
MRRGYVFLILLILLAGCQTKKPRVATETLLSPTLSAKPSLPSEKPRPLKEKEPPTAKPTPEVKSFVILEAPEKEPQKITRVYRPEIKKDGQIELSLDMEGADLLDFLDLLLKETLKVNYVVDNAARAKVTLHIHGSFTRDQIFNMLGQVLALNNLSLVKDGDLYRILPASKLAGVSGDISFAFLRPRYLRVLEIKGLLQPLVSQGAKILIDKATNTLLVFDNPENVLKVSRVVSLLDEDVLADMTLALYKPKVLDADTLAGYLKSIFQATPWKERRLTSFVDFIPMKEINALLIVARDEGLIKRIKRWIDELDKGELAEKEVFIYQVENGDAEEIADILQQAFSGTTKKSNRKTIVPAQKTKPNSSEVSGEVRIIPDKTNNLLVIKATRQDYLTIKRLLEQIDVLPRQVVIEMLIMEITLNKELEHGVEWFLKNRTKYQGDLYNLGAGFAKQEGRTPAFFENAQQLKGLTLSLYRVGDFGSLFNLLESISQINILSSPVILATDNKEARIQIGQEVPIITQQVTNTSATEPNITSTVQYRDTGIILDVKPHINSSGLVKLDIVQEISSAQKNYLGLENTPLITKRKIETSLVVKNNQTIVLGGLIDNRQEFAETGVPLLKDLPFIGHAFKWQKRTRDRTELLVAITPRVVRNYQEAEAVMHAFKEKIRALRERLEKQELE